MHGSIVAIGGRQSKIGKISSAENWRLPRSNIAFKCDSITKETSDLCETCKCYIMIECIRDAMDYSLFVS